jgi:hypothetical protein
VPVASWTDQDFDPSALIGALADGGVDFVVIGGLAVVLRAMPRFTKDLDICYSTKDDNLDALGVVLVSLEARLRGVEEMPFVPDARTLRRTQILCLTTPKGNLDLLVRPSGSPAYETLRERAETVDLAGRKVRIASIDDLIEMKRAAGRPQDLVDVESLEAAQEQMRS